MNTNEALIKRIKAICKEKESNLCSISLKAGMSPSALYDLMHGRTKYPKVITVQKFCEGAGVTLGEFFDTQDFDDIEFEID